MSVLNIFETRTIFSILLELSMLKTKPNSTHFNAISHFCNPWKCQKTKGFLTFSGAIEMEHCAKMAWSWCMKYSSWKLFKIIVLVNRDKVYRKIIKELHYVKSKHLMASVPSLKFKFWHIDKILLERDKFLRKQMSCFFFGIALDICFFNSLWTNRRMIPASC